MIDKREKDGFLLMFSSEEKSLGFFELLAGKQMALAVIATLANPNTPPPPPLPLPCLPETDR